MPNVFLYIYRVVLHPLHDQLLYVKKIKAANYRDTPVSSVLISAIYRPVSPLTQWPLGYFNKILEK